MERSEGTIVNIDEDGIGVIKIHETEELVEFDASEVKALHQPQKGQEVTFETIQVAYVNRRVGINVKLKEG